MMKNEMVDMHDPANTDVSLEERLVAYLDGELDAEASRRVEELLAADPQVRRRLQRLDHTWQLLDELDTSQVSESFSQTTLEMVAVAAAEDARQNLAAAPHQRRRRWVLIGGSLLAAGLAGFLTVALLRPDPNELGPAERIELVKELSEQQAKSKVKRPTPEDVQGLLRWMFQYATRHEAAVLQALPEPRRQQLARMNPVMRRRLIARLIWQRWQAARPEKLPPLTDHDLADLHQMLSDDTRKWLESKLAAEQWQIVGDWIRQRFQSRRFNRKRPGMPPP